MFVIQDLSSKDSCEVLRIFVGKSNCILHKKVIILSVAFTLDECVSRNVFPGVAGLICFHVNAVLRMESLLLEVFKSNGFQPKVGLSISRCFLCCGFNDILSYSDPLIESERLYFLVHTKPLCIHQIVLTPDH